MKLYELIQLSSKTQIKKILSRNYLLSASELNTILCLYEDLFNAHVPPESTSAILVVRRDISNNLFLYNEKQWREIEPIDLINYIGAELYFESSSTTSQENRLEPDLFPGTPVYTYNEREILQQNEEFVTELLLFACADYYSAIDDQVTAKKRAEINGNDFMVSEEGRLIKYLGCQPVVIIPEGIVAVDKGVFSGHSEIEDVILPYTLATIGDSAFFGCNSLRSVVLPFSLRSLGREAFLGCSQLNNVSSLAAGLNHIGCNAFNSTGWLEQQVRDNDGFVLLDDILVLFSSGTSETIPEITIPDGIRVIAENALYGVHACKVNLNEAVRIIEKDAFTHCLEVVNGSAVEYVGPNNFSSGVSFVNCSALLSGIGTQFQIVESGAKTFITISKEVSSIDFTLFKSYHRVVIQVQDCQVFGINHLKNNDIIVETPWYSTAQKLASFFGIPVKATFGDFSVYKDFFPEETPTWKALSNVEMQLGALDTDSIEEIVFNEESRVGREWSKPCFRDLIILFCKCFKNVQRYSGSFSHCFTMDGILFSVDKGKLVLEAFPSAREDISYTIPDGVTEIEKGAFSYSEIADVVIPASVKWVDDMAFYHCPQLTTVTMLGHGTALHGSDNLQGQNSFQFCPRLKTLNASDSMYYMVNGAIFDHVGRLISCTPKTNEPFIVPDFCTSIQRFAFSGENASVTVVFGRSSKCKAIDRLAYVHTRKTIQKVSRDLYDERPAIFMNRFRAEVILE